MSTVRITTRKNSTDSMCARLRVTRNLSQSELGERCGLSLKQISFFERTGQGKLKNVRKIAAFFGVTLDSLVRNPSEFQPAKKECPLYAPEGFRVTGVEYYRRKCRITKKKLSQITDVSLDAIDRWGKNEAALEEAYINRLQRVADALNVTMDQLCSVYPTYFLSSGDHYVRGSEKECPTNCITIYRRRENLSFERLARRMGLTTREAARINCVRLNPREQYIRALAKFECISVAEFMARYGTEDGV